MVTVCSPAFFANSPSKVVSSDEDVPEYNLILVTLLGVIAPIFKTTLETGLSMAFAVVIVPVTAWFLLPVLMKLQLLL